MEETRTRTLFLTYRLMAFNMCLTSSTAHREVRHPEKCYLDLFAGRGEWSSGNVV